MARKEENQRKAHQSQQLLTVAEKGALLVWDCVLQVASGGFPAWIGRLKQMAAAVLQEQRLRNILSAYDFLD